MKITVAKNAGFCFGVRRALDITFRVRQKNPRTKIYTLGPIIHNPQVIKALSERGIGIIDDPFDPDLKQGDIVIVRAHGIAPEKKAVLTSRGIKVIDATCPMVLKAHSFIKKASRLSDVVVIVGDKDHPELNTHFAIAGDKGKVVQTLEDAEKVEAVDRMAVVAQTTFDVSLYKQIVNVLRDKAKKLEVFDTICESTSERQKEVGTLAKSHDTFVVIGGRSSANTSRLEEIARSYNKNVVRIESASELKAIDARSMRRIAIIAGASTPQWVIEEGIAALRKTRSGLNFQQGLIDIVAFSPLCLACGSMGLAMAALVFSSLSYNWHILISVFFLQLSVITHVKEKSQWQRWAVSTGLAVLAAVVTAGAKGAILVVGMSFLSPLLALQDVEEHIKSMFGVAVFLVISIVLPLSLSRAQAQPAIILLAAYAILHYLGVEILKGLKNLEKDSIQDRMTALRYFGEQRAILFLEYGVLGMAFALFLSYPLKIAPVLAYGFIPPLFFLAKGIDICNERRIFDSKLFNVYVQCLWLILPFMGILWRITMM